MESAAAPVVTLQSNKDVFRVKKQYSRDNIMYLNPIYKNKKKPRKTIVINSPVPENVRSIVIRLFRDMLQIS